MTIAENGSLPQAPKTQEEQELEYLASPEATDDQVMLVARNQRIMQLIEELDTAARQVVRLQDRLTRRDLRIKFLERDLKVLQDKYQVKEETMNTVEPEDQPVG